MQFVTRNLKALIALALLAIGATGVVLAQQQEQQNSREFGFDATASYEVTGIFVDASGEDAEDARRIAWERAQREGWRMLYARVNGGSAARAPNLSDSSLSGVVTGIIVEEEQIGPTRYVARLGVMFDRARVSRYLGVSGVIRRSPPMLILPVQWVGNTPTSFEERIPWARAWLRFRSSESPIDYVRASATGPTSMLLTVGQTGRPGRGWWRFLLDSYGAADVVIPVVHLQYSYPGGPVYGRFVAYHGPDRQKITQFSLRVRNAASLDQLLDEGARRIDAAYTQALEDGRLRPDPSLNFEFGIDEEALEEALDELQESVAVDRRPAEESINTEQATATGRYTIRVVTPDANSVRTSEAAVRGTPGVRGATTSSLAIGGVSLMEVSYIGDLDTLASALAARGFQVQRGTGTLQISRSAPQGSDTPESQ
jgi:hypothetical protein